MSTGAPAAAGKRTASTDALRGLVMLLMLVDHVRETVCRHRRGQIRPVFPGIARPSLSGSQKVRCLNPGFAQDGTEGSFRQITWVPRQRDLASRLAMTPDFVAARSRAIKPVSETSSRRATSRYRKPARRPTTGR